MTTTLWLRQMMMQIEITPLTSKVRTATLISAEQNTSTHCLLKQDHRHPWQNESLRAPIARSIFSVAKIYCMMSKRLLTLSTFNTMCTLSKPMRAVSELLWTNTDASQQQYQNALLLSLNQTLLHHI